MKSKIILILIISSLIIGCVDNTNKNNLSSEEQKLIGTWSIKTQMIDISYTFNSDNTGVMKTQGGNTYFNWKASGGIIYSDNNLIFRPMGNTQYKLINNDKTLVMDGALSFDKSWW